MQLIGVRGALIEPLKELLELVWGEEAHQLSDEFRNATARPAAVAWVDYSRGERSRTLLAIIQVKYSLVDSIRVLHLQCHYLPL